MNETLITCRTSTERNAQFQADKVLGMFFRGQKRHTRFRNFYSPDMHTFIVWRNAQ